MITPLPASFMHPVSDQYTQGTAEVLFVAVTVENNPPMKETKYKSNCHKNANYSQLFGC